jgi:hypothetical protein
MVLGENTGKPGAVCPRCGSRFTCGAAGGSQECWCMDRPALPPGAMEGGDDGRCLCPACFDRLLSERACPEA